MNRYARWMQGSILSELSHSESSILVLRLFVLGTEDLSFILFRHSNASHSSYIFSDAMSWSSVCPIRQLFVRFQFPRPWLVTAAGATSTSFAWSKWCPFLSVRVILWNGHHLALGLMLELKIKGVGIVKEGDVSRGSGLPLAMLGLLSSKHPTTSSTGPSADSSAVSVESSML